MNDLQKEIRRLSITKRLNFLIGSGVSMPEIPGMNDEIYLKNINALDNEHDRKIDKNNNLVNKIKEISSDILNNERNVKGKVKTYQRFLEILVDLLNYSNSRQTPRSINIFSTNYDLFVEKAMDNVLNSNMKLVFNDGASGYFHRYLDSYNFDKSSSYRGQFERYNDEIPSISLIKPHGSINWDKKDDEDKILIRNNVSKNPFIVKPDGMEAANTFENKHFFAMLRLFQQELDKEESILIVIGFSFGDNHIKNMVKRALQNPSLIIYVFAYNDDDAENINNTININSRQLNILKPSDILSSESETFTISDLSDLLEEKN
ncbi:hypothetical protein DY138_02395 [Apilactobacillus timberlakei]|uniref:SIR2 family protein n=1 Tax=Apilactobacillus timberlakei TaxID=2008380 RepID=UPI0011263AF3|nr:SIR2 family protein [Apilactobacillus timberlakei]TPR19514.1 hypothetical protein DY138_02395 [Apilactobacillus timberlakei]TPR20491.1 hypothetical protein DY061_04035 [Apilactobacillus timberlakei]TPR22535.1 hypothetical protein DY083_03305 [Apilactobacillus timberlakei]